MKASRNVFVRFIGFVAVAMLLGFLSRASTGQTFIAEVLSPAIILS